MTISEAKAKVISVANAEVGYREEDNNWNKYAAELDPLGITYGSKQNQPWCGEWVLWLFYRCFGVDNALKMLCSPKPTGIPLCKTGAQYFKDAGRWYSTPEIGDIVFYYYSGDINHTGIVTGVSGLSITTVEGNSSDMVARHVYSIGNNVIAGYGRPKWDIAASTPAEDPVVAPSVPATDQQTKLSGLPTLQKGDRGEVVRAAQFLLNGRKCSVGIWGCDGDFGNGTQSAVLAFQRRNPSKCGEADGIIGERTWGALLGL